MTARRVALGMLMAGLGCAALTVPVAGAAPGDVQDCTAGGLADTIGSVSDGLGDYFAAHPDANQVLIDATRQPAFIAVGQFDDYFNRNPQQADEVRAIKQPLIEFQNRCGLQVAPAEAFVVLSEL
jgi:hemophore-related protein